MKEALSKKDSIVANLFNEIAKKYDTINTIISFGLDKRWRKKIIKFLPQEKGSTVLDIACGSCAQIISFGKKRPDLVYSGIDIAEDFLAIGKVKLQNTNLNIDTLLKASALDLPFADNSFSFASISFGIRNMESTEKALEESYRVLENKGKLAILEFSLPENRYIKKCAIFYLNYILPKIGNLLSNHLFAYTYLNKTIQTFPSGEDFCRKMRHAKFSNVTQTKMTFGMVSLYVGEKHE